MPRQPRYRLPWRDAAEYPMDREHDDGDGIDDGYATA